MSTITTIEQQLQTALSAHKAGNLEAAENGYRAVLAQQPKDADANNMLGLILMGQKQFSKAIGHLRKAVKQSPQFVGAQFNLGVALEAAGKVNDAIRSYKAAIVQQPGYLEAQFALGNCYIKQGRMLDGQKAYAKVLVMQPNHLTALNNMGTSYFDQKDYPKAIDYLTQVVELRPEFEMAHANLGTALLKVDQLALALEHFSKAVALNPQSAKGYLTLGNAMQQAGDMKSAQSAYQLALKLDPYATEAFRDYSSLTKYTDVAQFEDAIALLEVTSLSDERRMHLNFGLSKAYEDLKDYTSSMPCMLEGNRLKRATYKYDLQHDASRFHNLIRGYSADVIAELKHMGSEDATPIFVVGMPRSGTTLVEQIISSHSLVYGAGELEYMDVLRQQQESKQGGKKRLYDVLNKLTLSDWSELQQGYLQSLRSHGADEPYITDKLPHNFMNIGLIHLLFPQAKIVHCVRNPIDNCLSIFKNLFSARGSHKYAYSLKELGQYYNQYLKLMDHWHAAMPGVIHDLVYEELTGAQEQQTKMLLDYCGLQWEQGCLDFHTSTRKVATASSFQVRQPINQASVNLWQRYGDSLLPLIEQIEMPERYKKSALGEKGP